MPRVIHFEMSAQDPERAVRFYQEVFGWRIQKWDGPVEYWLMMTGDEGQPGIDGGLMRATVGETMPSVINTIDVDDVDAAVSRIEAVGGKVLRPKMPVPGVGWMAYCQDTEGNVFGIMQVDESAG